MVLVRWRFMRFFENIWEFIQTKRCQILLTCRSLSYCYQMDTDYMIDVALRPIFWFVDNFAKCLGKVFVTLVLIFTFAIVSISYWIGLPYWWERNKIVTIFLMIVGNWLLLNVLFHYYKGIMTSPGYPPPADEISEAASICKKCIFPKPPRTHHCSVCDTCILAMDHHCPWLNNCVGHYNSRHFFLYMVYVLISMLFIMLAGLDIGIEILWVYEPPDLDMDDPDLVGHPVVLNQSGALVPVLKIPEYDIYQPAREHILPIVIVSSERKIAEDPLKRKSVYFMFFTCVTFFFALSILVMMHAKNISQGETSVESHINKSERKKANIYFHNPYDYGRKMNWKLFLGLTNGRTFFRHVILPSGHKPVTGNGIVWNNMYTDNWNWS